MRIAFYLQEPYPYGMACTTRIHLYAKGLIACGNDVKIIIPKATEKYDSVQNEFIKSKFEGVAYEYASKTTIRSKSFIKRRFQDVSAFINSFILIRSFNPDIVLLVSNSYLSLFGLFIFKQIGSWKLIREKSEIPFYHKQKLSLINKILVKFLFSLHDGIIVISNPLREFFLKELKINCKYHITPILIEQFEEIPKYEITNNIVYTGSLSDHKDGVIRLIQAFSKVSKTNPQLRLVMTGDLDKTKDKKKIMSIISEEGIESNIEFTGYITKKELKSLIHSAKILVLAKPENRQNRYNSATKVGEYLLTGRPVILSNVDTSCEILKDGKDVFMVKPTIKKLRDKIEFVMDNHEIALKVGEQGRVSALKNFDYISETQKLDIFLKKIK